MDAPGDGAPRLAAVLRQAARAKSLRLVTRGRKTGLPRAVTVWFVSDGDAIALGTLDDTRNWVRNARASQSVELEIGGARLRGRFADVRDAGARAHVQQAMAKKYWVAWVAGWLGIAQKHTFRVDQLELLSG